MNVEETASNRIESHQVVDDGADDDENKRDKVIQKQSTETHKTAHTESEKETERSIVLTFIFCPINRPTDRPPARSHAGLFNHAYKHGIVYSFILSFFLPSFISFIIQQTGSHSFYRQQIMFITSINLCDKLMGAHTHTRTNTQWRNNTRYT